MDMEIFENEDISGGARMAETLVVVQGRQIW